VAAIPKIVALCLAAWPLALGCKGSDAAPAKAGPAAGPTASPRRSAAPPPRQDAGAAARGGSALARLRASADHRRLVSLARSLQAQLEAGRCEEAAQRAPELSGLIRRLTGPSFLSLDLKEMAGRIQADPHFMEGPYMRYKAQLQGAAVGFEFVPMSVNVAARKPQAKRRACAAFAKALAGLLRK